MEQKLSVEGNKEQLESFPYDSQVLIQRHAKSIANESYERLNDYSNFEELSKWICDPSLRDPKLCETGYQQCVEARKAVSSLRIHTIFVSPLRRALETAYNVYKTHPDFKKIRFIVLPWIRESLNTSSDFPSDVENVIEEFKEVIPQLDSSLMDEYDDKKHFFIEDLQADLRDKIKEDIVEKDEDQLGSNAYELFIKESKAIFPARLESKW
eukprot:CAMPEP_0205823748 /NCGR_PEP_ID=MMETSP0206-20130828/17773_1 /ASSEMBLY_ACC=CAM_ASM_000279 /TAXON_ID=36767 /ORGANISM="Euplotes focardii, Strain TN1" /LENGTH=210 /DNA_ID=CAMNT_0053121191 /DNA_START=18 /DNA_END=647 /DNA_ORIENTATION=-